MKLELYPVDLETKHRDRNCSTINFEHFKPSVRTAIIAVGRATFYEFDGRSYNAIYPPKQGAGNEQCDRDCHTYGPPEAPLMEVVPVCAGCVQEKPLVGYGMCAECFAEIEALDESGRRNA